MAGDGAAASPHSHSRGQHGSSAECESSPHDASLRQRGVAWSEPVTTQRGGREEGERAQNAQCSKAAARGTCVGYTGYVCGVHGVRVWGARGTCVGYTGYVCGVHGVRVWGARGTCVGYTGCVGCTAAAVD